MKNFFSSPYTPPSGPPQISAPKIFDRVGEENLRGLALAHYTNLASSDIRKLFPQDSEGIAEAARKQAMFWIGITGGPPLYMQEFGHPRMRARHLPFAIDEAARQEWLRCMREALGDGSDWGFSPEDAASWVNWLEVFSAWMVNRAPS